MDYKHLFDEYINPHLLRDLEHLIETAKKDIKENKEPAGRMLCGLGFMAYTEFMGWVIGADKNYRFQTFMREMGKGYREFLDREEQKIARHTTICEIVCLISTCQNTPYDLYSQPKG